VSAAEEIVDLVDEDDRVVGHAPRREVRTANLLHREVAALVRNGQGLIYVHRRTDTKDVFPGLYDLFVAGVVASGESYEAAIRRELAEELGIAGVQPALLFKQRYRDRAVNWWACIYEVAWEGPVRPQAEEIAWGGFVSEAALAAMMEERPFVPDGRVVFQRYVTERASRCAPLGR